MTLVKLFCVMLVTSDIAELDHVDPSGKVTVPLKVGLALGAPPREFRSAERLAEFSPVPPCASGSGEARDGPPEVQVEPSGNVTVPVKDGLPIACVRVSPLTPQVDPSGIVTVPVKVGLAPVMNPPRLFATLLLRAVRRYRVLAISICAWDIE
jgi:hypothetical protein